MQFLYKELSQQAQPTNHPACPVDIDAVQMRTLCVCVCACMSVCVCLCVCQLDRTALHWAAANGHVEVVQALIEADADLNFADKVT